MDSELPLSLFFLKFEEMTKFSYKLAKLQPYSILLEVHFYKSTIRLHFFSYNILHACKISKK